MTVLDQQVNDAEIKIFREMLRKIELNYGIVKADSFWREYCYRLGNVVEIILKELREKSVRVEKELGDAEKMKVVYVCEKCKLTFPQYPALRHCIQCGRELARLEALK